MRYKKLTMYREVHRDTRAAETTNISSKRHPMEKSGSK